jgi:hypothetical protein
MPGSGRGCDRGPDDDEEATMILRCWRCSARYAAADRPADDPRCPECDAPRARSDRRCAIADRLGAEVSCPIGGCHLARALGAPLLGSPGDPCPVERIALRQPDNPLVLSALDDLRRELEGLGGPHVDRIGRLREPPFARHR